MKISSWVDFHLSNTQAWVRNSTPPLICHFEKFSEKVYPKQILWPALLLMMAKHLMVQGHLLTQWWPSLDPGNGWSSLGCLHHNCSLGPISIKIFPLFLKNSMKFYLSSFKFQLSDPNKFCKTIYSDSINKNRTTSKWIFHWTWIWINHWWNSPQVQIACGNHVCQTCVTDRFCWKVYDKMNKLQLDRGKKTILLG